jgi:uncharacterized protein (TIGR03790 family)
LSVSYFDSRISLVFYRIVSSLVATCALASCALGALEPNEIVIVAARGNRESEGLARYYARVRGVPEQNLCFVDMPAGELIPREMWKWGVRPEIRKWLVEHDPEQKIRCLLTVWGVPLKIGPAEDNDHARKYQRFLEDERAHRIKLLGSVRQSLDQISPQGQISTESQQDLGGTTAEPQAASGATQGVAAELTTAATAAAAGDATAESANGPAAASGGGAAQAESDVQKLRAELEKSLQSAQVRLAKLGVGQARTRAQTQLQQLAAAAGGASVILHGLNQQFLTKPEAVSPAARSEFDLLRGRAAAFSEVRLLLDQTPPSIERDALVLALLERIGGLLATVDWIEEQLRMVTQNESGASFDNELALLMWPDDYQLLRWQPNYLRPTYDNSQLPKAYRTFMVARLDAPTLLLAKGLVDTAMKIEKEGLRGKVYIDARGMATLDSANSTPGSYADYDKALLVTAQGLDDQTELEVVLDTTPELFQPGACPDAALYCGWYSLGKYVDAFDWKPGAVAYHLASGEAHTLRDPASQAWCKKMLEDGVCATIGPVYEPYLAAFPRPNEFFGLLVHGELTLVECFARSSPFNSWMITLIGDPLYRPFKYRAPVLLPTETPKPASEATSNPAIR